MSDVFEALREKFRERCARELARLSEPDLAVEELRVLAHGLAGAGGTFGFPEVSAAAADLEEALDRGPATEAARARLADALRALA